MIRAVFGAVVLEPWDGPLIVLPDAEAVRRCLNGRFVSPTLASEIALRAPRHCLSRSAARS